MTIDEWNDYYGLIDHLKVGLSDAAERRRFALLDAAAKLYCTSLMAKGDAVALAVGLLEEIECREQAIAAKEPK